LNPKQHGRNNLISEKYIENIFFSNLIADAGLVHFRKEINTRVLVFRIPGSDVDCEPMGAYTRGDQSTTWYLSPERPGNNG